MQLTISDQLEISGMVAVVTALYESDEFFDHLKKTSNPITRRLWILHKVLIKATELI